MTGVTTLALTNYDGAAPADPMYAVPDGILHLRTERHGQRDVRRLGVAKLRGSAALMGWHDYQLGPGGLRVHPRLEAQVAAIALPSHQPSVGRADFGIAGLDALLGGGVPAASVTLLAGAPGAGKTLVGLSFLAAGAAAGERGLYVGFRETRDRLIAKAEAVGVPLGTWANGRSVALEWLAPLELLVDALAEFILTRSLGDAWRQPAGQESSDGTRLPARPGPVDTLVAAPVEPVREGGGADGNDSAADDASADVPADAAALRESSAMTPASAAASGRPHGPPIRRVFLDGLDDLRRSCLDPDRLPALLAAVTDLFRAHGVSVLLSQEIAQPLSGDLALPVEEMSAAVDNIVLLRYHEAQARIERRISVLKVREHGYSASIQPFTIGASGIVVAEEERAGDGAARTPASDAADDSWASGDV